jgi:hypothetical protein
MRARGFKAPTSESLQGSGRRAGIVCIDAQHIEKKILQHLGPTSEPSPSGVRPTTSLLRPSIDAPEPMT